MTEQRTSAPLVGGVALLERALAYTRGSLLLVTDEALARPSPCRAWDLRQLLVHMNDSLAALHEAAGFAEVRRYGEPSDLLQHGATAAELVGGLRDRGCTMLGGWARLDTQHVTLEGRQLSGGVVAAAGALEVAVHGWDVAKTCGATRPLPAALAVELLELSPLLVTQADRPHRFGVPVHCNSDADASTRLLAFLGRTA